MDQEIDYNVNFFRPTTELSRINRNLIIVLILVWAIAIFGFQILLRVMEKPTPEASLITFEKVWDNVKSGTASEGEKIEFTNSVISVLGKSSTFSDTSGKSVLHNAFSWAVYDLLPEENRKSFKEEIAAFEGQRENVTSLTDNSYVTAKSSIIRQVAGILGLKEYSLEAKLIPLELRSAHMETFTAENKEKLPDVMSLYLTHNQSILTDTVFLGFPFHYFYTAVFLLVLFVFLCWIYCFLIDRLHSRLEKNDENAKS
ncbi:MAG: DUF4212 domain-containing protein [Spirochaetaceae bacterium]|nr:DUF4212 domain-containing protein [Spirochaetaceae bacterium]